MAEALESNTVLGCDALLNLRGRTPEIIGPSRLVKRLDSTYRAGRSSAWVILGTSQAHPSRTQADV